MGVDKMSIMMVGVGSRRVVVVLELEGSGKMEMVVVGGVYMGWLSFCVVSGVAIWMGMGFDKTGEYMTLLDFGLAGGGVAT